MTKKILLGISFCVLSIVRIDAFDFHGQKAMQNIRNPQERTPEMLEEYLNDPDLSLGHKRIVLQMAAVGGNVHLVEVALANNVFPNDRLLEQIELLLENNRSFLSVEKQKNYEKIISLLKNNLSQIS